MEHETHKRARKTRNSGIFCGSSGASLSAPQATAPIGANGAVSLPVRANMISGGPYSVAASAAGVAANASFALTNGPHRVFLPLVANDTDELEEDA